MRLGRAIEGFRIGPAVAVWVGQRFGLCVPQVGRAGLWGFGVCLCLYLKLEHL